MRCPDIVDLQQIERKFHNLGFLGYIGAVDCAGWDWHGCASSDHGIMTGKDKRPVVRMEVVADIDLYSWHIDFGFPG